MEDDLAAHLIELELRLLSGSTRTDARATAELLSEEFREFGASGRVWDRATVIAALSTETPNEIVSEDFECRRLSDELALLTYVATTAGRTTLRSSLWRLEEGQWRMLFHQGTVIPPGSA